MDTKALRQKILDLAIRGKLVPQDPNDEPASVLLERIRAEKQQMVKEGKLKPKDIKNDTVIFKGDDNLHYEQFQDGTVKCIEDEIPFELPDGWEWTRLGVIGSWQSGATPSRREPLYYENGTIPWLKTGDLCDCHIKNVPEYITEKAVSETSVKILPVGTVLIAMYGATIGKTGISDIELTTNQACCACVCEEEIYNEYLLKFLQSQKSILVSMGEGGAQPNISKEKIINIIFPLPPFNEQKKIVSKIEDFDRAITSLSNNKDEVSKLLLIAKSKILDLAICGKLVPQDPNDEPASVLLERIRAEKEELIKQGKIKRDKKESVIFKGEDNSYYENLPTGEVKCIDDELPFDIPEGWEWCNLSMLGTTNIGLTYKPTDIDSTGTVVLRSCNIVSDRIDYNDLVRVNTPIRGNQYVQKNDILICARNGSKALVGKCAIIPDLAEPTSFGAFMAIYRTKCYSYIIHFLRSQYFRSVFFEGNSTTINQLTQDMLKRAVVPFPPKAEQNRIVSKIQELYSVISEVEAGLN